MNTETVRGLDRVIQEAKVMNSVPFSKRDRAEAIIRRGLCFLIREISATSSVYAILEFAREVSRRELLKDPSAGLAAMEALQAKTPSDVPVAYWALATDVFFEAASVMGVAPSLEDEPMTSDGAEEGVVATHIEKVA